MNGPLELNQKAVKKKIIKGYIFQLLNKTVFAHFI